MGLTRRIFSRIPEKQIDGKVVITCLSCNTDIIVNEEGGKFLSIPKNMMAPKGTIITDDTLLWNYATSNHKCRRDDE